MVECTRTLPLHVGIVPAKRPKDKWEAPQLFQILFKLVNVNSAFYSEHNSFYHTFLKKIFKKSKKKLKPKMAAHS